MTEHTEVTEHTERTEHTGLAAALAAFQMELPTIVKGNEAKVKSERTGAEFKYQYADLADISPKVLPLLGKHGLAWTTRPNLVAGEFLLHYALVHTSGETVEGEYPLPSPDTPPQQLGSAITYARRYALCAVTGVAPGGDDDDAQAAQAGQSTQSTPARSTATRTRKPAAAAPEPPQYAKANWAATIVDDARSVEDLKSIYDQASNMGELGMIVDPKFQTHIDGMAELFKLPKPNGPVRVDQAIAAVRAAIEAGWTVPGSEPEPEGETTEWETVKPGEGVAFR